jgi:hypothetical protein
VGHVEDSCLTADVHPDLGKGGKEVLRDREHETAIRTRSSIEAADRDERIYVVIPAVEGGGGGASDVVRVGASDDARVLTFRNVARRVGKVRIDLDQRSRVRIDPEVRVLATGFGGSREDPNLIRDRIEVHFHSKGPIGPKSEPTSDWRQRRGGEVHGIELRR